MRGTMSLRKKIAILTMASMTVWGVTALLPFNQGRIVGNVGYAAEITPEKQVSMDYKTSGGTTAQTTGDLYYAFIDSTNSWWATQGKSLLLIAAALEPQRHLLRYTDRS